MASENDKKTKPGSPFDALQAMKDRMAAAEKAAAEKKGGPPGKPAVRAAAPSPTAKAAPRAPDISPSTPEDEALQFHRLFGGVQPIDRSRGRVPKSRGERSDGARPLAAKEAEAVRGESAAVHDRLRELAEGSSARFEVSDDGRHVEGRRVDVPVESLRRLRRGNQPIDGRIDLHGMVLDVARTHLESTLRALRAHGERCVLVIHGKGEHSPGGVGVLRGEMAAWLSQGPSSVHVAAFASAAERDGGDGAVYVLLRR